MMTNISSEQTTGMACLCIAKPAQAVHAILSASPLAVILSTTDAAVAASAPASREMIMVSRILVVILAVAVATVCLSAVCLSAPVLADDAAPDSAGGRYTFNKTADGVVRLDSQTG